jgi:hypothetical protein
MRYATRYLRLLANSAADPDNPQACWVWTGTRCRQGYGRLSYRVAGRDPRLMTAHRAMLEEVTDATFPLDEGGHLCFNPGCIHPDHLEVQTPAFNKSERRGYAPVDGCMIPTLFPREDALQAAADRAWDEPGEVSDACPF